MERKSGRPRSRRWLRLLIGPLLGVLVLLSPGLTTMAGAESRPPAGAGASSWLVNMNRFAESAHSAFNCEDCHGTMVEGGKKHPDPDSPDYLVKPASRRFDYRRCRKCHQLAYDRYTEGGHAKALAEEAQTTVQTGESEKAGEVKKTVATGKATGPAPTCGECHVSHYARSKLSRVAVGTSMVTVCGRCHADHAASYMENIHGRVGVDLKDEKSAFCSDCHGAHRVIALKQTDVALTVCRRCHPKAQSEFTNVVIHASVTVPPEARSAKDKSTLWIQRVRIAAMAVLVISLVFFFGHSLLWLLREMHEKLRKR